ncbi:MAG: hypothetical protein IID41_17515 [Planctomycetes bacterium]|nr:hypothetical protein [Planctomycetota bacterium]
MRSTRMHGMTTWVRQAPIVVLILLSAAALSSTRIEQEKAMPQIDGLRSANARARDEAVDAILHSRKAFAEELVRLIDPDNAAQHRENTRSAAAYLLGELRDPAAVPVLARALREQPDRIVMNPPRRNRYAAAVWTALVKIGRPAVPAMIDNIEGSDDRYLRDQSLYVLNHVLGGKRRVLELLAKLEARSKTDATTQRIRSAASWVSSHFKEDKEPLY